MAGKPASKPFFNRPMLKRAALVEIQKHGGVRRGPYGGGIAYTLNDGAWALLLDEGNQSRLQFYAGACPC